MPLIAPNRAVRRCCPSITKSRAVLKVLSLIPICPLFSKLAGDSQSITYPIGYPFNIESNKSRTLLSFQTKGLCKSGKPIRPFFTSLSKSPTLLGMLSNNSFPITVTILPNSLKYHNYQFYHT